MSAVLFVLVAYVFQEVGIRYEVTSNSDRPWTRVSFRIVKRLGDFQVTEIVPMEPFYRAQHLSVRMSTVIEPRPVVVTGGGGHKHIALPLTHRVTHEIGVGIAGQLAPIQEDLPVREVLAKNYDQGRGLNDFQRSSVHREIDARAEWQAMDAGRVGPAQVLLALFGQSLGPRLDISWFQIGRDIRAVWSVIDPPDARKVGFAIGGLRRRRGEIRLAVGQSSDARSRVVEPLPRSANRDQ